MGKYVIDKATLTGYADKVRRYEGHNSPVSTEQIDAALENAVETVDILLSRAGDLYSPFPAEAGKYAFANSDFTGISLPNLTTFGTNAFQNCAKLQYVSVPKFEGTNSGTDAAGNPFDECEELLLLDLGAKPRYSGYMCRHSTVLSAMILRSDEQQPINTSWVQGLIKAPTSSYVGRQGYIYVPAALLSGYEETYPAFLFRAIEDYPVIRIYTWIRRTPTTLYEFSSWYTTTTSMNKSATATVSVYTDAEFNNATGKMIGVGSYTSLTGEEIKAGMEAGTTYYYRYSATDVRLIRSVDKYTGTSTSYAWTIKYSNVKATSYKDWENLSADTLIAASDPDTFPQNGHDTVYMYEFREEFVYSTETCRRVTP